MTSTLKMGRKTKALYHMIFFFVFMNFANGPSGLLAKFYF